MARARLEALLGRNPDVIALQEMRRGGLAGWQAALAARGYASVTTLDLASLPYPPPPYPTYTRTRHQISRLNFNLIASRLPIEVAAGFEFLDPEQASLSFPEKHLAASIRLGEKTLALHNTHLPPGSSRGRIKVHAFEAIRRRVDQHVGLPTVLCGDFNCPVEEPGPITRSRDSIDPTDLWAIAEAELLQNPNLRDVYEDARDLSAPYPVSHVVNGRLRRRYDHILASPELRTVDCRYHEEWREKGLSDHAAVEADFELL